MRILKIKYLEDRIVSGLILAFYDRIAHAGFLHCHVILKHRPAVQADPLVCGRRYGNLNLRILLHIKVNVLRVVGAEPELFIHLKAEHERAALRLAVTAYGCQILYRIRLQELSSIRISDVTEEMHEQIAKEA